MREIKFRAWDKEGKHMVRVDRFDFRFPLLAGRDERGYWHDSDLKYYELMQYTGLKDKNGKEIYEGDLILQQIIVYSAYHPNDSPEIVVFDTGCFCLAHKSGYVKRINELSAVNENCEVIGNIYENPELLKGGK